MDLDERIRREIGDLRPPAPYARTDELEAHFAAFLPDFLVQLGELFARRTPKVSKRQQGRIARTLKRHIRDVRPYLLALGALSGQLDVSQSRYALLEGLLRAQMNAGRTRLPYKEDAFAALLRLTKRLARPNRRVLASFPEYAEVRRSLLEFAAYLVRTATPRLLEGALTEWGRSADLKKYGQFVAQWATLVRQFRIDAPRRITSKIVLELGNEYRVCSGFFEQRLRLLDYLRRIADKKSVTWAEMQKVPLGNLLELAAQRAELAVVAAKMDRNLRNALAHGTPQLLPDSQNLVFHDRDKAVTLNLQPLFSKTRGLTVTTIALIEFESLMQFETVLRRVSILWRGLAQATRRTATSTTP